MMLTLHQADEMLGRYSGFVTRNAERTVRARGVVEDPEHPGRYTVQGSRQYVVHLYDGHLTCTCVNGQHTGGQPTCYHSAAVLMVVRDRIVAAERMRRRAD